MRTDYNIHYWGYQLRNASPSEKMSTILAEIRTPATALLGYAQLLGEQILEYDQVSPQLKNFQTSVFKLASQIVKIRNATFGGEHTQDSINQFTANTNPIIDDLLLQVEEINQFEEELVKVYPEVPNLVDIFQKNTHHIWATIDSITNPNLMLPDSLIEWVNIREEVREKAHSGDISVFDTLLKAIKNPVEDIRKEAIVLISFLKHPETVTAVISALEDESATVREEAVYALGKMGDKRAIEPLKKCLSDEKEYIQRRAAEAIESLGGMP